MGLIQSFNEGLRRSKDGKEKQPMTEDGLKPNVSETKAYAA